MSRCPRGRRDWAVLDAAVSGGLRGSRAGGEVGGLREGPGDEGGCKMVAVQVQVFQGGKSAEWGGGIGPVN